MGNQGRTPAGVNPPPAAPVQGMGVRSGGVAKVKRFRWAPLAMWALGIAVFLLALAEALLRAKAPQLSHQYAAFKKLPEYAGLTDADFNPARLGKK